MVVSSDSSDEVGSAPKKRTKKKFRRSSKTNKRQSSSSMPTTPSRPRKSLIRKRPVSFGNPALGTYHGCLYTLDVAGEDYSPINTPIVEGAESVERVVAMVDVPPEQVPEGILNLARSHRPYIQHVRIVIAEIDEEVEPDSDGDGEEAEDEEHGETNDESRRMAPTSSGNSASLLPNDETTTTTEMMSTDTKHDPDKHKSGGNSDSNLTDSQEIGGDDDDNFSVPARTYVILLELCSVDAAEEFVNDLHGKPYTSLDPTQTCSVYQVLALSGEDGVSLLSPFFAPSARSTSPKTKASTGTAASSAVTLPVKASEEMLTSDTSTGSTPATAMVPDAGATGNTTAATTPTATTTPAAPAPIVEDYNCAVCLEHMILSDMEEHDANDARASILTTVCNHSFHLDCLLQWQDSPCPVCRYDHSGLNEALSQCNLCGATENNYVCLICGVISCGGPPIRSGLTAQGSHSAAGRGVGRMGSDSPVCGVSAAAPPNPSSRNIAGTSTNDNVPPPEDASRQLSQSHARQHYDETLHAYALDTETQHVWDFAGQGYVHRLLQNKEDGKLVEFHDPSNTSSHERSLSPGLSDAQEGEVVHRKLEGFASQYYTLLKSQLEQQRSYYQGRLEELRRESLMRKKAQTSDLVQALKQEKAQLSKRLGTLKARRAKVSEEAAFLKNMNESLEKNKEPLKRRIVEAQRERSERMDQLQQRMPALEEKVTMLMLQLTDETGMEGETTSVAAATECAPPNTNNPKTLKHSNSSQSEDRKPAAKR